MVVYTNEIEGIMEIFTLMNSYLSMRKVYVIHCLNCYYKYEVRLASREWHIVRRCVECNSKNIAYKLLRIERI